MLIKKLLRVLSDGQFHSGKELEKRLDTNCTAILTKMQVCKKLGLVLDSVRDKKFRLKNDIEWLDRVLIQKQLAPDVIAKVKLHIFFSINSTNDQVKKLRKIEPSITHYCLAEYQKRGRGRLGRSWHSPFAATINLSVLWQTGKASLKGLSLAVGVGILSVLELFGARNLKLKWPNDVLWYGKKICGVLLEGHRDPTGQYTVIIGIGINIKLSDEQLAQIDQPAVDLYRVCNKSISRNAVISQLINTLTYLLDGFNRGGFAIFHDQWIKYDACYGKQLTLEVARRFIKGRYVGINNQGELLLETDSEILVFNGGEVSLH